MKKPLKRIVLFILVFILTIIVNQKSSSAYVNHSYKDAIDWVIYQAASNQYIDMDYQNGCQCVDLIYAYQYFLTESTNCNTDDAISFALDSHAIPSGWTRYINPTIKPEPGDIVVWYGGVAFDAENSYYKTNEEFGHIGIVYAVPQDGSNTIWTVETNGQPISGSRTLEQALTYGGVADDYARKITGIACYIRPDWNNCTAKPTIPSNLLNLGDNFHSYIMMSNTWDFFNVDNNSEVVLQNGINGDTKQVWNFVRQSDGSYTIKNVNTGRYLDVMNSNDIDGGVIRTFSYNGSNAQKFFLYGNSRDCCVIRPACSQTRTVSVSGGANAAGNKLNMFEYWGAETQLFNLYNLDSAKASKLSYSVNGQKVKFTWTNGENVGNYNLIIYSGTPGNVKEYKKIVAVGGTSYEIDLPAGYYEVCVEGWNWFSNCFSDYVKFNVNEIKNGLVKVNGTWYYYKNDVVQTDFIGLVKKDGTWYYIQKGKLIWGVETLVKKDGTWFYVKNSMVDWTYTGLVKKDGTWFYVQKGVLHWGVDTLVKRNGTWFYVKNSMIDWSFTGLFKYNGTWYYIQKGELIWGVETLVKKDGTWFYVNNSMVDWSYTGLVEKDGTLYYVQKGILKWGYNGTVTYKGKKYTVKNSMAV